MIDVSVPRRPKEPTYKYKKGRKMRPFLILYLTRITQHAVYSESSGRIPIVL